MLCRLLKDSTGRVSETRSGPGTAVPFKISARTDNGVTAQWLILPDREIERPFRSFIRTASSGDSGLSDQQIRSLSGLLDPPRIDVYAARWCENSASAVAASMAVAVARPGVSVRVLDVESFDRSLLPMAMSVVPLCVIGGRGRLYGACGPDDVVAALEAFCSGRWARQTVLHMLDRKMRSEILDLVKHRQLPAEELGRMVGESGLAVRMGAILVLADLAKVDRGTAGEAVPALLSLLDSPDAHARADAIYALGEIRDVRSLPYLENFKHDEDPDVAECAREAMAAVKAFNVLRH